MAAKIYYSKPTDHQTNLMMGLNFIKEHNTGLLKKLKEHDISDTHQILAVHPIEDPNEIFKYFQGENWSPNGEARELIKALGLKHTSMSVGDIVVIDDDYFFCDMDGWIKLCSDIYPESYSEPEDHSNDICPCEDPYCNRPFGHETL